MTMTMRKTSKMAAVLAVVGGLGLTGGLTGCAQSGGTGGIDKRTGGAVLGGVLGAVGGAQFGSGSGQLAATAVGTLLGAYIGSEVGQSLDRADQVAMERSTATALETKPSGSTVTWNNPDTGHRGSVTPVDTYYQQDGTPCRQAQHVIYVDGQQETAEATYCRQSDGTWRLQG